MADQQQDTQPQAESRYERVRRILDAAQGSKNPSYQGLGRFWNLPLEQLLKARLYGIRLIADPVEPDPCDDINDPPSRSCCQDDEQEPVAPPPPPEGGGGGGHSCCGSNETTGGGGGGGVSGGGGGGAKPSKGRGAASGLIKGLNGEFPFNNAQFPPLMWGGQRVSASDIIFIQSWIDDGCPASDAEDANYSPARVAQHVVTARAQGDEEHPLSARSFNEFSSDGGGIKVRKNVEWLTDDELARLRRVFRVMKCYDDFNQYDQRSFRYWADIHANNCQHGWEQFLTWHRAYLYHFEQHMQDVDETVTLPYWDWTQDSKNVQAAIADMKLKKKVLDNGYVPPAFRCFVDERMLANLKGKVPAETWSKLSGVVNKDYNSGSRLYDAAGLTSGSDPGGDALIRKELERANPLWIWQRWPGGNATVIFHGWPKYEDVQRILQIPSFYNFGSGPGSNHFFGACESIHNLIHNFTGGVNPDNPPRNNDPTTGFMVSAGTTARDPIFWAHHGNVDRLYAEWQGIHPGVGPDDPNDVLPPWKNHVGDMRAVSDLGYEYVKSAHVFETDPTVPIVRFKSAAAAVHPAVLGDHRNAEIRLHKVQYSTAGGAFIRVFINQPDADADTPTQGNDHFVAQVATFSGDCIGGPGHCDVPPDSRRKYDLRARHRKTPGNFRIDATEAVRRLAAGGATDLRINLVVLGLDGAPKPDALRMDGVTLHFKD